MYLYVKAASSQHGFESFDSASYAQKEYLDNLRRVASLDPQRRSAALPRLVPLYENYQNALENVGNGSLSLPDIKRILQNYGAGYVLRQVTQIYRSHGFNFPYQAKFVVNKGYDKGMYIWDVVPYDYKDIEDFGLSYDDTDGWNRWCDACLEVWKAIEDVMDHVRTDYGRSESTCHAYFGVSLPRDLDKGTQNMLKNKYSNGRTGIYLNFRAFPGNVNYGAEGSITTSAAYLKQYMQDLLRSNPDLQSMHDTVEDMYESDYFDSSVIKSTSADWSKTINLQDYFPEECFDEDGEFDESLASEDDWITFNLYEVQNGFGDTKNLYSAVLTKAGFPVYSQLVSDPTVDNDGNLEFIMYGDAGLGVPDIRFGFDMDIDGSEARIILAYANTVE